MRWVTLLLVLALARCTDVATLFEDTQDALDDSVSSCEVELVLNQHGSHSTLLVYASPFDRLVTDSIGGISGSCRGSDCQWSLPVIGHLDGSDVWYQVFYEGQVAWVSTHRNARLVGSCVTISTVEPAETR